MTRIVLDTNVLMSAILNPHGSPGLIIDRVLEGKFSLCLSPPLIDEARRVIRYEKIVALLKRSGRTVQQAEELLEGVISAAEVTPGKRTVTVVTADPDDNMVLACTLETKVDFIVSGDQHLTDLGKFQGVQIISPGAFLMNIE